MKAFCTALLIFSLIPALPAQDPLDQVAPAARLSPEEVQQLVGPIALYPDPLIALILPASTFPSDIVLGARFVDSGADPALADQRPWDASVRGLIRYPDILKWLDENLEWTTQLGDAYLTQPEDVMDAIQVLRAKAESVGNLVDTPEQRVVVEESYIRIVPANPEYIYVPYYDPEVVYYERYVDMPLLSFSMGCQVGPWLSYDFDWHRHRLYCGEWHQGWNYHRDYDRDSYQGDAGYINHHLTNCHVWQGDSRRRLASSRSFTGDRGDRDRPRSISLPERFSERSKRPAPSCAHWPWTTAGNSSRPPPSPRTIPRWAIATAETASSCRTTPRPPSPTMAGTTMTSSAAIRRRAAMATTSWTSLARWQCIPTSSKISPPVAKCRTRPREWPTAGTTVTSSATIRAGVSMAMANRMSHARCPSVPAPTVPFPRTERPTRSRGWLTPGRKTTINPPVTWEELRSLHPSLAWMQADRMAMGLGPKSKT